MAIILTTDRLLLREFELHDAPFILALCNNPTWLQYIGDRGIKNIADAMSYVINGPRQSYQINGFGLWLVALKDTGVSIGMCGLVKRDTLEDVDIGYALLPQYAGKGYAFEAAAATLKYAFEELRLPKVVAISNPKNSRSVAVLTKLGFAYEKNVQLTPEEQELMLFGYVPNS